MKITIPQAPEERPLIGTLSRKSGRFVFLLDAPTAEPYPLGASNWADARRQAEILLYLTRRHHGISAAPFPSWLAYMEGVGVHFGPDPSYSRETREILNKDLFFLSALFIDKAYQRVKKTAETIANGKAAVSRGVTDTWATVDGSPLHIYGEVGVRNTGEIVGAFIYAGRPAWIAGVAKERRNR